MPKIYALNAAINDLRSRHASGVADASQQMLESITQLYTKRGWSWEKRLDAVKEAVARNADALDRSALLYLFRLNRGVISRYNEIDASSANDWRIGDDGKAYLHSAGTYAVGRVKNAAYVQEQLGNLTDMIKGCYKAKKAPVAVKEPLLPTFHTAEDGYGAEDGLVDWESLYPFREPAMAASPAPTPQPPAPSVPEPVHAPEQQPAPVPLEVLVEEPPAVPIPAPAPKKPNFLARLFDEYVAPIERRMRERHPEEAATVDYWWARAPVAACEGSAWVWRLGRSLGF